MFNLFDISNLGEKLNLSSLINLPLSRYRAVIRAAKLASNGQNYSAQQVIDSLAFTNYSSFLPQDGCCFSDTSGTSLLNTTGTVGSFRGWSSVTLLGVSNASKAFAPLTEDGLDLSVSKIDLTQVNGNADGTILSVLNTKFGDAIGQCRPFHFGISGSALPGTNVDGPALVNFRLGTQGSANFNFSYPSSSANHTSIHTSKSISTSSRDYTGYYGNSLLSSATVSAGGTGTLSTFSGVASLGSDFALPNGFTGRMRGFVFLPNVTSLPDLSRVARFTQFYYQDLATTSLIDRQIITLGTSITYGAGAVGSVRWVDEVAKQTQSVLYAHGKGSNRITAPLTATPWDNVMSATIAEASQPGESYQNLVIPFLNILPDSPIVLIDHNVNDNNQTPGTVSLANTDRTNYVGALNYVANEILATRPDAIIIGLTGFPDARSKPAGTIQNQLNINQAMRDWTTLRGFELIDVATILDNNYGLNPDTIGGSIYLADSVHPTPLGHQVIAEAVIGELIRIFG